MWKLTESNEIFASFECEGGNRLRAAAYRDGCLRVTATRGKDFLLRDEPMIVSKPSGSLNVREDEGDFTIASGALTARLDAGTGALCYAAGGEPLVREPDAGGRTLREIDIVKYRYDPGAPLTETVGVDGARVRAEGVPYTDRKGFQTRLNLVFSEGEVLYGLGQHEEGVLNHRGGHQFLYQHNLKVSCPVLMSSKGWGVLYNSCAAMTFHDDAFGSYLSGDADDEMDFFLFHGPSLDEMIRHLRALTGDAPIPPKWAFGFVQSKERYKDQDELVATAAEYRRRGIPLDVVVQDWYTWPEGLWGQKTADETRYPDIPKAAKALNDMDVKLMWSIWPNMSGDGENRREFREKGLLLGNRSTYDAFSPEGRAVYWRQADEGLFSKGIDAWWCDCTEPFEADWFGAEPMTPEDRMLFDTNEFKRYIDPAMVNAYSIYHSQGIWEGQRAKTLAKRVLNLTRSGFPGQQRYGAFVWNGDTSANWETLKKSIPDGLNFCLSGQPYWTQDAGAFFVKRWAQWFGRGEYEMGCEDPAYRELFLRWFQMCAFLPMLRAHGTDTPREVWRFGSPGEAVYDALVAAIELRMRLLPYVYSLAFSVRFHRDTMLRMLAFDFMADPTAREISDQFLLGRALMACPVTEPGAKIRRLYLPSGADWYDFFTEERYSGGQWIDAEVGLDRIPVFVRAGSILPVGPVRQHALEESAEPVELRVYAGADGEFDLYDDAGDGYGYEKGAYGVTHLQWDDRESRLRREFSGDARYEIKNTTLRIIGGSA